jgi:beta-glucanase (GH16 family)
MRSIAAVACTIAATVGWLAVASAPASAIGTYHPWSWGQSCGGQLIQKSTGGFWRCTFDDEFNSTSLDTTKWVPQTAFVSGDPAAMYACYQNDPSNISESAGALHLTVQQSATPVWCPGSLTPANYSAGMVSTYHLWSQQYGRFEVRMRVAAASSPGLNEDFWMWPDDRYTTVNWPASGEMDVSQQFSNDPNDTIPYLHYTATDNGGPILGTNEGDCAAPRGTWNTYDLVWTASSITISVNGTTCLVNTSGDPAFQKPYVINLTEALGNAFDEATASTPLPATMDVDYVRVWQ